VFVTRSFQCGKEKGSSFSVVESGQQDGSTQRPAVKVVMRARLGLARSIGLEQVRIERRVLMKLVDVSVIVLGSALQRNAYRASRLAAVLGVVRIRHHAEFGNSIGGRYERDPVRALIGHAIEQEFVRPVVTASIDADLGSSHV